MIVHKLFHVPRWNACAALLALALAAVPAAARDSHTAPGETMLKYVREIEREKHDGRGSFIKARLKMFKVPFMVMPFETTFTYNGKPKHMQGENIIVRMGGEAKTIVVGAHFDAVFGAPGANDNGSGVAVLLGMIHDLKDSTFKHTIEFCFFDLEERGLLGSAVYVRQSGERNHHLAMINLDMEGTGDEICVAPTDGIRDSLILRHIRSVQSRLRAPYDEEPYCPESDHESFSDAGLASMCISVLPSGDGKLLSKWSHDPAGSALARLEDPRIIAVMHTPNDTSQYVSPASLALAYTFTMETLLSLDRETP